MLTNQKKYKANRPALKKLFRKSKGKCCYCGCDTILPKSGYQGPQPINIATIEHEYNNFDIRRLFLLPRFKKIKLACWKCNQSKGRENAVKHYEGYNYTQTHDGMLINFLKEIW